MIPLENTKGKESVFLKVAVLLDRPALRIVDLPVAYKGFEIPDEFVVGYGLDYKENFRHLPYMQAKDSLITLS